jgi:malate dehydrogenase (oxaloacetate-decarboxylating)
VAVLSDCSRVLGLGKIGAYAGIPVMEGKCALFKSYANIDAFPICLLTYDKEEIIKTAEYISPVFGGINLEDIESPKCFEIEKRLNELLDIPVFHDDQHGTAIVVLAGLINALKLLGKNKREVKVVIAGAGAAGYGITNLLFRYGFENILVCDRNGILVYDEKLPEHKKKLAKLNKNNQSGTIRDALEGADVFIGVSSPNILNQKDIEKMASSPIVFALSNPIPEILPDIARNSKIAVFGTARADLPNQINNVIGFPGIFRGAFLVRSRKINEEMKIAAADALASVLTEDEIKPEQVVPFAFDKRVVPKVAEEVALAAIRTNVARINKTKNDIEEELRELKLLD